MKETALFTVAIIHYNQPGYIQTAIDSVLKQDYPAIELLLADDCSADFDEAALREYIGDHAGKNIKNVFFQRNIQNLGTVKNLNRVISNSTGEYILFFAADDALYNSEVLSRFVPRLEALPKGNLCVSAQCLMMDQELRENLGDFTDVNLAARLNEQGAREQFKVLLERAFYGVGASAFRRADFDTYGRFDEQYALVEDWSYFLAQTRAGRAVDFAGFYALRHREGGVSHNICPVEPAYVRTFKEDIMRINEQEILPYFSILPIEKQVKVLGEYDAVRKAYAAQYGVAHPYDHWAIVQKNPKLFLRKAVWFCLERCDKATKASLHVLPRLMLFWMLLGTLGLFFAESVQYSFGMSYVSILLMLLIRYLLPALLACWGVLLVGSVALNLLWKIKKLLAGR
ncbi:MAG: glycosyltransferase family A protein [Pygmaiobacter sp.]